VNVFEVLGEGYTLLAFGTDDANRQVLADAAHAAGVPLKVLHQALGSEADRYDTPWVLVRPDQFIAWVGESLQVDAQQAQELFQRIRG
jgi:hypothetical protein